MLLEVERIDIAANQIQGEGICGVSDGEGRWSVMKPEREVKDKEGKASLATRNPGVKRKEKGIQKISLRYHKYTR